MRLNISFVVGLLLFIPDQLARFGIEQNYNKKDGVEMSGFDRDTSAHELLILQNYTSLSSYYGIPEVISAVAAIMGNKYESDYNLQFFQNNAIPRYVIIVRGGRLNSALKRKIKDYDIHSHFKLCAVF